MKYKVLYKEKLSDDAVILDEEVLADGFEVVDSGVCFYKYGPLGGTMTVAFFSKEHLIRVTIA